MNASRMAILLGLGLIFATGVACTRTSPETSDDKGDDDDDDDDDDDSTGDDDDDDDSTGDDDDDDDDDDCGTPNNFGTWNGGPVDDAGVTVTNSLPSNDANLSAVIAAAQTATGNTTVDIAVSGAIIQNIGFPPATNVWMADSSGGMRTFLFDDLDPAPVPGDEVSFTVTEVSNYQGELEITGVSNWSITSSGNDVYVADTLGSALDYATQGRLNQRTYGEITGTIGECGTEVTCFEFTHGGVTDELRVGNTTGVVEGDCLHVVAPVFYFSDNALFDLDNWDWFEFF